MKTSSVLRRLNAAVFAAVLAALCAWSIEEAGGASVSWTGNLSNTFLTAGNWNGTNTPPISGDDLAFGVAGTSGLLLNNNLTSGAFEVAGITFNVGAGSFVIGDGTAAANVGNTFALTGDVINHSGYLQTINNPFSLPGNRDFGTLSENILLGGTISGSGRLSTSGAGTLVLSGTNTYTGGTTISAGATLQMGNGGGNGWVPGNTVNDGTFVFNRNDNIFYPGVISGSGGVVQAGLAIHLDHAQTYTGPTTIAAGSYLALSPTEDYGLSASTVVTIGSGGTLDLSSRAQKIAGLEGSGKVWSYDQPTGSLTVDVAAGQTHNYAGVIGADYNHFSLIKSGPGTQIVTGANNYDLGTTITEGTLQMGDGGGTGWVPYNITNHGTFVFNRDDNIFYPGVISGSGGVVQAGLAIHLDHAQTYTGPTTVGAGSYLALSPTEDFGLSASTVVTIGSGGTLDISSRAQKIAGLEGSGKVWSYDQPTGSLTVEVAAGQTHTYAGVIGADFPHFAFTKSGSGTQILTGANNYTGATTINSGTLSLTGSLNGTAIMTTDEGVLSQSSTGGIGGASALTLGGSGTNILAGVNTYTGATNINSGTLQLGGGGSSASLPGGSAGAVGSNGSAGAGTEGTTPGGTGGPGGPGGPGGATLVALNNTGTLHILSNGAVTGGNGGAGGSGGRGGNATITSAGFGGGGGSGGTGGLALTANGNTSLAVGAGGILVGGTGGAGGDGGEGGIAYSAGPSSGVGGAGGLGGVGGMTVAVNSGATLTILAGTAFSGGTGGKGGNAGPSANNGFGQGITRDPHPMGGGGGSGGAAVGVDAGGTLFVPATATLSGGAGGTGGLGSSIRGPSGVVAPGTGGSGGAGAAAVVLGPGGSLFNSGTITGGQGGNGGGGGRYVFGGGPGGLGGSGGAGGAGVFFSAGGSFANAGTVAGGSGVIFSGAAGSLSNQNGGVINGGVSMGDFPNTVTLEAGSRINGDLSIGTDPGSVLTLTGVGNQLHAQAVTGVTTFAGALTKSGTGTWTLDQPFTYSGPTSVNAGTLRLTSSLGATAITVAAGAVLDGEVSIAAGGSLTLNNGSTLGVNASTAGALTVGGNVTLNGTVNVAVEAQPATYAVGQSIRVLNYAGTLSGSAANLVTTGTIFRPAFSTATPNQINLIAAGTALTWSGGTAVWDVVTTANWNAGGEKFFHADVVTFDDTGINKNVVLNTTAHPLSATFANSAGHAYSITGTGGISGAVNGTGSGPVTVDVPISGAFGVTQTGTGTLTLSGANTYTGGTTISPGATLRMGNGGGKGWVPGNTVNAGTFVFNRSDNIFYPGVISGSGGVVQAGLAIHLDHAQTYTGPTTVGDASYLALSTTADFGLSASTVVTIGSGGTLDLSSRAQKIAGLEGGGKVWSYNQPTGSLTVEVAAGQTHTYAGIIGAEFPNFALTKAGPGRQILSGANDYTGTTIVSAGTLVVDGSIASSPLTRVLSGGTLAGGGTVGALLIDEGGILSPGNSPGTLHAGNTNWTIGGSYLWEINDALGGAGMNWDLLSITGTLTISATAENPFAISLLTLTSGNASGELFNFNSGQSYTYTLATASGGIVGFNAARFSLGLSDFANSLDGGSWSIAQSGHDLNLVFTAAAIPEPATWATILGALSLAFVVARRRRT